MDLRNYLEKCADNPSGESYCSCTNGSVVNKKGTFELKIKRIAEVGYNRAKLGGCVLPVNPITGSMLVTDSLQTLPLIYRSVSENFTDVDLQGGNKTVSYCAMNLISPYTVSIQSDTGGNNNHSSDTPCVNLNINVNKSISLITVNYNETSSCARKGRNTFIVTSSTEATAPCYSILLCLVIHQTYIS